MNEEENENYTAKDWYKLGKNHSSLKNSRSAINSYKKCVQLDPKYYKAWSNMAAEYFQLKNYKKSISSCIEAIKVNQKGINSWLTLAANYFHLNEDGRALYCFQKAAELGSLKAQRFLNKANRLKDKLLEAEVIDVFLEIFPPPEPEEPSEPPKPPEPPKKTPAPPESSDEDYIDKLAGFLLEISNDLIMESGEKIPISKLYTKLKAKYDKSFDGSPRDILRAIKMLDKTGLIVGIEKDRKKDIKFVEFFPSNLTADIKIITDLASESKDLSLAFSNILENTSWDEVRINKAMEYLERKGIAKREESYREGIKWYFPTLK